MRRSLWMRRTFFHWIKIKLVFHLRTLRSRRMINVVNVPVALGILCVFFPNNKKSDFCFCISY